MVTNRGSNIHPVFRYVKTYAPYMTEFLVEEFCPTTESDDCAHHVADHYVEMIVREEHV